MKLKLEVDKPEVKKTIVVYSGRFQPFHKGHFISYQKLVLIWETEPWQH